MTELDAVVGRQPDRTDAHFGLGVVRYAQGEVSAAIDEYRQVLVADPQQPDAHYHLGLLSRSAQRAPEATPEFSPRRRRATAARSTSWASRFATGLGVPRDVRRGRRLVVQGARIRACPRPRRRRPVATGRARAGPARAG